MTHFLNRPLRMNLQLFAADTGGDGGANGGDGGAAADGENNSSEGKGAGTKITFTAEQQTEIDRILGERLGKAQSKWEKEYQDKLEAAKTEAEKLAKMNADQKAQYEQEQRESTLKQRETDITRRELRATALETLAEKGLPKGLVEILDYTDADKTNASIAAVETAFREAVENGINERLRGETPRSGAGATGVTDPFTERLKKYK
ncbi:phage capsid protein [Paenibacillus sp. 79R4]|uniref:DUF4355 domain-containing protein n=1 Tax=Paenibacillus sp. 79R4 TaxID=2212847 RepID=UPI0015BC25FC|nr:DUF4355 domain-containing protein [Paenibacillus sp. 79R4]NWL87560.1 phage capsid protein [Paenibacillus sp. 79R4]